MQAFDFAGAEELVEMLDVAVEKQQPEAITESVKEGLCRLIGEHRLRLPPVCSKPASDHYARRLIYRSEEHGYTVVAMTWGPGQGTPLHDHAGLWCVEGVCQGQIRVEQFELRETDDDRYRFDPADSVKACVGSAGCLIPPYEYHRIVNASNNEAAVTLHVYGSDMTSCNVFQPVGGNWYQRQRRSLSFD
ncbi:MAG: cysteine dioxygenase family protein [Gammaproteobacteria bacterium]|jgi:predicted metal-dependent enzyme (double-stranded beta helix superfamily)